MDTSETYIRMCRKAEEIQPKRKPVSFDEHLFEWEGELWATLKGDKTSIWLPRQDQLQKMMGNDWLCTLDEFEAFHASESNREKYLNYEIGSMEQLWLAFVMHERFGKIWSGTEWIKKT